MPQIDWQKRQRHTHWEKCSKVVHLYCSVSCILSWSLLTSHLPKILNIQKRQWQLKEARWLFETCWQNGCHCCWQGERRGRNDSLTNCHHISANRQLIPVLARPIFDWWCQLSEDSSVFHVADRNIDYYCCWRHTPVCWHSPYGPQSDDTGSGCKTALTWHCIIAVASMPIIAHYRPFKAPHLPFMQIGCRCRRTAGSHKWSKESFKPVAINYCSWGKSIWLRCKDL